MVQTVDINGNTFWQLVTLHGLEADRHLLQCLFSSVDFAESTAKISVPSPQNQVLLDYCSSLLNKSSLLTAVCCITDNPLVNHKVSCKQFEKKTTNYLNKNCFCFFVLVIKSWTSILPTVEQVPSPLSCPGSSFCISITPFINYWS